MIKKLNYSRAINQVRLNNESVCERERHGQWTEKHFDSLYQVSEPGKR